VLQCVVVCCSVLQCFAVRCSVLQCGCIGTGAIVFLFVEFSLFLFIPACETSAIVVLLLECSTAVGCCSVFLQCLAMCYSLLQFVSVWVRLCYCC